MLTHLGSFGHLTVDQDPEAVFQQGWLLCDVGEFESGLAYLQRAVTKGYFVTATLRGRSQFDALRGEPEFLAIVEQAEAGRTRALTAFHAIGGERIMGSSRAA